MKFFRRIKGFLSSTPQTKTVPKRIQLIELIDHARREQYSEDYEKALQLLSQAMQIAETEYDTRSKVDITLSRADILIAQGDFKTAEFVLNELKDDGESRGMKAPLAYALASLGTIAQKKDEWEQARDYYEQAREIADSIKTDGASGRAAAHLADVYLHEGNASYAIYLLEGALEKLIRSGDRELLGYFQGQLGIAKIASGYEQDGILMLQKGLESAIEINYRPQQRRLHLTLGEQAIKTANFRRAYQHYFEALSLYSTPPPETSEYTRALCQISKACIRIREIGSAKDYAQKALIIAEKLENETLIAMAKACLGLASDEENAMPYLQDALVIYEQAESDSFHIDILRKLAALEVNSGNIEKAKELYQQALDKAESMPIERAQIHSELAKLRSKQKQRREAIEQWQEALRLYQESNQGNKIGYVYCEIAVLYEQLGDGRMAKREYGYALEQLGRVDDSTMRGLVLANVAAAYSEFGDIDSAADFFKESIEISQRNRNRAIEALRRGNYGHLLALSNRPKEAISQLTQAHRISEEMGLKLQATVMLGNMGLSYAAMQDHDAAMKRYDSVLETFEKLEEPLWQAIFEANAADSLVHLGRYDEASEKYESALAKSKQEEHVPALAQTLIGQVSLALAQQDIETAKSKIQEVDPIARRLQYRRYLALLHQAQSQVYAAENNSEQAQSAWDEAIQYRNTMGMPPIEPDWL